jgi:hypothetical protein
VSTRVTLRPYISTTAPVRSKTGITIEPVKVFVTGFGAEDAEPLQSSAHFGSGLSVLVRQPVTQRSVGKAELEVIDHLRMVEAAASEIPQRFRRLFQRPVIVIDDLIQDLFVIGADLKRRFEFDRLGCAFSHHMIEPHA